MTLEECCAAEFPEFESLHNYRHCMVTLDWILDGYVGFRDEAGCIRMERYQALSPHFVERVAMRDDNFSVAADGAVFYLKPRFRDKVMTPWWDVLNKSLQKNGNPVAPVDWRVR